MPNGSEFQTMGAATLLPCSIDFRLHRTLIGTVVVSISTAFCN